MQHHMVIVIIMLLQLLLSLLEPTDDIDRTPHQILVLYVGSVPTIAEEATVIRHLGCLFFQFDSLLPTEAVLHIAVCEARA